MLSVLSIVKPKTLYIISDGGVSELDKDTINESRNIVNRMVDWECHLIFYKLDKNLGPYEIWNYGVKRVFEKHDRAIILEEDILPSVDYFQFVDELLERYLNDFQIYMISGMNFLGTYPSNQEVSYFFVNKATTWGLATWKRGYERLLVDVHELDTPYFNQVTLAYLENIGDPHWFGHLKMSQENNMTHNNSMEYYYMGINENLLYNSLAIVPAVNLVKNIGNTSGSENADESRLMPRSMRRVFELPLGSLKFPLQHPKFRIIDYNYRNLLMRKTGIVESKFPILIRIERAIRILLFKGPRYFFFKLNRSLKIYSDYDIKKKRKIFIQKRRYRK